MASAPTGEPALPDRSLSDALGTGNVVATLDVSLSNEIVHLLSEQLYTSPLKAIEELVVNSYDADAEECRIGLLFGDAAAVAVSEHANGVDARLASDETDPVADVAVSAIAEVPPDGVIAIYDDGEGMDLNGLKGLWRVGDS